MSKLRENPEAEVPKRVLMLAPIVTLLIFVLSLLLNFNFFVVGGFFWLATVANMTAFRLIVAGAKRLIAKKEEGQKATLVPNLLIRYAMYVVILLAAWFLNGIPAFIAAFIGVQMSQIAIKLDSFVG